MCSWRRLRWGKTERGWRWRRRQPPPPFAVTTTTTAATYATIRPTINNITSSTPTTIIYLKYRRRSRRQRYRRRSVVIYLGLGGDVFRISFLPVILNRNHSRRTWARALPWLRYPIVKEVVVAHPSPHHYKLREDKKKKKNGIKKSSAPSYPILG